MLADWYRLVWERELPADADPLEAKLALARFVVGRSHGEEAARRAEAHFTRVVREGGAPDDVPEAPLPPDDPVHLPRVLADTGLAPTTSEARRLIAQGAVRIEGEPVHELDVPRERLRRCARPGRKAPVRPVARRLTLGDALLLSLGCPQGRHEVPDHDWSAFGRSGYDGSSAHWRPLARVGGFFSAGSPARSLKTQQRERTPRPRVPGAGLPTFRTRGSNPVTLFGGRHFELKLD